MAQLLKIEFRDVLEYVTCPLRLAFKKDRQVLTRRELYSTSMRSAILTFFNYRAAGMSPNQCMKRATKKFNDTWFTGTNKFKIENIDYIEFFNTLSASILSIYKHNSDIVVGTQVPIEFTVNSSLLLTDTIDILLINDPIGGKAKVIYRGIIIDDFYDLKLKRYIELRAAFFRLALQREYGSDRRRNFSFEVRSVYGQDIIIEPGPGDFKLLKSIVENVAKAISNGIKYPAVNPRACSDCPYREDCDMKL